MKNFILRSFIVLTFFSHASASPDTTRRARERNIDIKYLSLDLRFDWKNKSAFGVAQIVFSTLSTTDRISLDAALFTINSITLQNGKPLLFDYKGGDGNDNLLVTLDRVYKPEETVILSIDYRTNHVNDIDPNNLSGSNGKGLRFFEPTFTDPRKRRQIWSMSEVDGNRYWFPGYDAPNDLRTTDFKATVANDLAVVSNGAFVEGKDNGDGTTTFHWRTDIPYANHLTAFAVGTFRRVDANAGQTKLHTYGYPDENAAVIASTERFADMAKYFEELTGKKYPYPVYSQVTMQDIPWGVAGLGMSIQSENMIDDYGTHKDFLYLWDGLEGESLAQQWFGGCTTPRDWSDYWLAKGLARYTSGLYNENKNGKDEFLLWQHSADQASYLWAWNGGEKRQPLVNKDYEDATSFAAGNYPYFKGPIVLRTLHKQLGDEAFRNVVRRFVKDHENELVTTEDFRQAVEDATGKPMDWFFDQWIYGMGHPIFEVTKTYDVLKGELVLSVSQKQVQDTSYHQSKYFGGRMTIEIDDHLNEIDIAPKQENIFRIPTSREPKLVHFDFESTWVKEIKFEKTLDEILYQLLNDRDPLGRSWAIGEAGRIAKEKNVKPSDKDRVVNALRTLAQSNAYWRLRIAALSQLQGILLPAGSTKLDKITTDLLLKVIREEKSWLRASAIGLLGQTRNPKYAQVYIDAFSDESDRVVNSAAVALARSKSPKAYPALMKLPNRSSWKNQSLMATLSGLKELGDPRGASFALRVLSEDTLARWYLPTPPVWDVRVVAAQTLAALGKGSDGFSLIRKRFDRSMEENDTFGIFNNVLLQSILGYPKSDEILTTLREKYKDDPNAMAAIAGYAGQFK